MELKAIFSPSSIAVIGASRTRGTIGRDMLRKLVEYGFNGIVYPVNPAARFIHSMRCYRSVLEIPDPVDMAVICVPKHLALQAVEDCGRKDVKAIIMITAGFSETGPKGAELERQVFERVRHYGMRMIGPNCMGVINTDPNVQMDAVFAGPMPVEGNVGFLSQSGALGVAILERTAEMQLGFSSFVSLGNRTDISTDDILWYWKDDPRTDLVLLYIESFGNAQRFAQIAREMVRRKPIIAVKSGRYAAGARAISSHTASLAATDVAVNALLESTGVIRVDTVEKQLDYAQAFAKQPIPRGNRVAVMSNGGGPAILATDAVEGHGLKMAAFSDETLAALRKALGELASAANPVDMVSSASHEHFEAVASILLNDPNTDALIVLFVLPVTTDSRDVARAIVRAYEKRRDLGKPVMVCFMTRDADTSGTPILRNAGLPVYTFPESAAQALAAMDTYRRIRERPAGTVREFNDVDKDRVRAVLDHAKLVGRTQLLSEEVSELMRAWGFPVLKSQLVEKRENLPQAAKAIGYPLVMKIVAEGITHKSDVGGVKLNLRDERDLLRAYDEIAASVAKLPQKIESWSVMLEPMISGGREVVMGLTADPSFGNLVMVGTGGIYVEVLKDVAFRLAPLTDVDAEAMVQSLRGYPILEGVRGEAPVHLATLYEQLARLSALAVEFPEIREMDMNPFLMFPEAGQCVAVDARITLGPTGGVSL
jgi:acetyltransferase